MAERLTMAELAVRAGVSQNDVGHMVDARLLTPGPDSRFAVTEVTLVKLISALERAGIRVESLEAAVRDGLLSFAFLDLVLGREGSEVSGETFEERCRKHKVKPGLVAEALVSAGLPKPFPAELIREEDKQGVADIAAALEATGDPSLTLALLRVLGENLRRITEMEAHVYHVAFEQPLLRSGLTEREMRDSVSQRSPHVRALAERILTWLYRRHQDHHTFDHLIEHIEDAMEVGQFGYLRPKSPPAVGFVDISGYTSLTEQRGDEAAAEVARSFSLLADSVATEMGGRPIKWLGDGVMLYFPSPSEGVEFGLEMVRRAPRAELPSTHCGISAGPVVYQDGDYFGRTVNLAARVAAHATAGEVLVTEDVLPHCSVKEIRFSFVGAVGIKGVHTPVALYRAAQL